MKHKSNKTSTPSEILTNRDPEPKIPDNALEYAAFKILTWSETIHDASHKIFGTDAWFKAYLKSQDFADLNDEWKGEAFETYIRLQDFLKCLDDHMDELTEAYPHN